MDLSPAPYFPVIDGEPEAKAYWAHASDGVRIRVAHWALDGAKGTVLLFPGRSEYIEKYAITAADLAEHGYGTFAIDWRGQGIADRLVENQLAGYVEDFGDYQLDVVAALDAAQHLDLPKPWYLLGHSMGGAIGLRALLNGLPVQAAAFSGPMWGVGSTALVRAFGVAFGSVMNVMGQGHRIAPGAKNHIYVLNESFEENPLTTDRAGYERLQEQARQHPELMIGGFTIKWALEALKECAAMSKENSPAIPSVTILGSDEAIVNPDSVHDRIARWANGELIMVESGQHEILMDSNEMRGPCIKAFADLFAANT